MSVSSFLLWAVYQQLAHTTWVESVIVALYYILHRKTNRLLYLFAGADIIDRAYINAQGKPFEIETPGRKHVMVTSHNHIKEISEAPLNTLSLHAVAKDFLQPKHTMHGFEWKDQRGIEGTGFVRALRSLLTSNLPSLIPRFESIINEHFRSQISKCQITEDYRRCPIFSVTKSLVTKVNCEAFFGPELSRNQEFVEVASKFPEDIFIAAEFLRILPNPIAAFIAKLVTRGHQNSKTMYELLFPVVEKRLRHRDLGNMEQQQEKPRDVVQWLVDTSSQRECWSTARLVGETMGVWYGSVHTLAIATTYAVADLYSHDEYIEPLRNEVESCSLAKFKDTAGGLPLLDSFLKESARLSTFESTSVRRQALKPFVFTDGLRISAGDWVCIPHRSMMRDNKFVDNALEFDAFRSVNSLLRDCNTSQRTKLVDTSEDWLVWGSGRTVCPGRFYAVMVLKLVLVHLLLKYDCRLQKTYGPRSMQWRSAVIPKESMSLLMKPRQSVSKG